LIAKKIVKSISKNKLATTKTHVEKKPKKSNPLPRHAAAKWHR
jgi:hypothetical protein